MNWVLLLWCSTFFAIGNPDAISLTTTERSCPTAGPEVSGPIFQAASSTLKGVKLSHTHIKVRADQDGCTTDVATDNMFAVGYVKNSSSISKSLVAIKVNDRLKLCGELYTSGVGIH